MGYLESLGALPVLLIACFLFVLAVLWFLLPFAVFGIYSKLKDLLRESKRTNDILERQARNVGTPPAHRGQ